MKNLKYLLVFFSFLLFNLGVVNANSLSNINITIDIDNNGSAHIKEVWDMNNSDGTEVFKTMKDLGNMEVSNFKVTLGDTLFTYNDKWNINDSFDEKKYQNGINTTSEGIELCWGISSYGDNTYTISYDVSNFVFLTSDAQVIYYNLFNVSSDIGPKTFSVVINGFEDFSDNLDVWGYGYKGYAYVYEGKIMMSNEENTELNSSDYVVLLVKFPSGTFIVNENNIYSDFNTFEDIYNKAEEGTFDYNYNKETFLESFFRIISTFLPIVIIFIIIFTLGRQKKYKFESLGSNINTKEINNFRDIPCDKNIYKAYFIAQAYKLNNKNTDFLGSVFLKWVFEKKIELKTISSKKLFGSKEEQGIVLKENLSFDNEVEESMYQILLSASKDNILESKELEKWSKSNYNKLFDWFTKAEDYGKDLYVEKGFVYKAKTTDTKWTIKDDLKSTAIELAGLKKYLIEFSRIKEKSAIEVMLWKDYLMFAQIFGIADQVAEQFKNLYPEIIEMSDMDNNISLSDIILINHLSNMTVASAMSARSAAQSYSAGGGGFSSGGGGGGSFGGGSVGTR